MQLVLDLLHTIYPFLPPLHCSPRTVVNPVQVCPYGWAYLLVGLVTIAIVLAPVTLIVSWLRQRVFFAPLYATYLTHGFLIILVLLTLFPLYFVTLTSFDKTNLLRDTSLIPNPDNFSTANYTHVLTKTKFWTWMWNTVKIAGTTAALGLLLAASAGYTFARLRFLGRRQVLAFFIFGQMFPGFLTIYAIYRIMSALGLVNTHLGLILAYSAGITGFTAWIYKGYLEGLPVELEEAGMIDGLSRAGAFWRIVLPLSLPILIVIYLLQFIGTFNEWIFALLLLRQPDQWTLVGGLRSFVTSQFTTEWGRFSAMSLLGMLPILILFFSVQKYIVGGLTQGATKG
ncbi:MAG: sugar ABC transporter permease [Deinococcus sp.]|nr:sugar ABC transporter permease [Deinococcus sp.]